MVEQTGPRPADAVRQGDSRQYGSRGAESHQPAGRRTGQPHRRDHQQPSTVPPVGEHADPDPGQHPEGAAGSGDQPGGVRWLPRRDRTVDDEGPEAVSDTRAEGRADRQHRERRQPVRASSSRTGRDALLRAGIRGRRRCRQDERHGEGEDRRRDVGPPPADGEAEDRAREPAEQDPGRDGRLLRAVRRPTAVRRHCCRDEGVRGRLPHAAGRPGDHESGPEQHRAGRHCHAQQGQSSHPRSDPHHGQRSQPVGRTPAEQRSSGGPDEEGRHKHTKTGPAQVEFGADLNRKPAQQVDREHPYGCDGDRRGGWRQARHQAVSLRR